MKTVRLLILLSLGAFAPFILSGCHSTHYSAYGGVSTGGYGVAPLYSGVSYYHSYYPTPWYRSVFWPSRRYYAYPGYRGYYRDKHGRKVYHRHNNRHRNHPHYGNGSGDAYKYYANRGNNGTTRSRTTSRSTPVRSVAPATRRSTSGMMGRPQARTASLRSAPSRAVSSTPRRPSGTTMRSGSRSSGGARRGGRR